MTIVLCTCDIGTPPTSNEITKAEQNKSNEINQSDSTIEWSESQLNTQSDNVTDLPPYAGEGRLYEEEIVYYLGDFGNIYWDAINEYYVLNPRDTFRQEILGFAEDPFDEAFLIYWDFVVEMIQLVTEEYPSSICVSNPVNTKTYLLVVVNGEVAYSAF